MTDLDKRADELLADACDANGMKIRATSYRTGNLRHFPEWLLVRRLIEPPSDAKLEALVQEWRPQTVYWNDLVSFLHFAFDRHTATPTPRLTWDSIAATLRAAGYEAMAVKVETGR